jgi:hypothetical protein
MADWLLLICQHPPQPPCKAASPPRSCPRPPSRLPFRAEPPMRTTRSLTVCPGLAARCAGAIDARRVRLVAGLARGRGPGGVLALWAAHSMGNETGLAELSARGRWISTEGPAANVLAIFFCG